MCSSAEQTNRRNHARGDKLADGGTEQVARRRSGKNKCNVGSRVGDRGGTLWAADHGSSSRLCLGHGPADDRAKPAGDRLLQPGGQEVHGGRVLRRIPGEKLSICDDKLLF